MGFMTGQKIYENFTNGVGPDGLAGGAAIVNELAAGYAERADAIRRIAEKLEAAWQGEAAGAARRGLGPVQVEHDLAGQALATAQDLTGRQAGSFADARNAVVPDPWVLFTSPGEVATYRQKVAEFNAASQHNVDVMTGYSGASTYNANGLPRSYGALAGDQAGIAIGSGTSDPDGRPQEGGSKSDNGVRGIAEWFDNASRWVAPPADSGGPASSGTPSPDDGGRPGSQESTPGGMTPAPGGPAAASLPVTTGGGSGPLSGGGPVNGLAPGPGSVPVGGGSGDGSRDRGPSGAGGRRAVGGPGAQVRGPGGGAVGGPGVEEVRGPGGRAGGEPHGAGGRLGAGPLSGGAGGEPSAAGRGAGAAGRASGPGGLPVMAAGRGRGGEDIERYAPEYLREDDPDGVFGADELAAPPVIGAEFEPAERSSAS